MRCQPRQINLIVAACLTTLWLLASTAPAQAQEFDEHGRWINGFTEPWFIESSDYSRDEIGSAITRWLQMGDGANGDEWAGQYGTGGDTHGTYVRWSPEAGYVMLSVNKCEARVMSLDYGKVESSSGLVRFISGRAAHKASPADGDHSHPRPPRISNFLTVKWRGSRYLVPEKELARFCDQAAGLGMYNSGIAAQLEELNYFEFFGKSYKKRGQVSEELPILPEGYEQFVKSPVEASVTAVGAKRTKRVTLEDGSFAYEAVRTLVLDAGSLNGVKRGMTLRLIESDEDSEVKITRVGKRSATGILVRHLDDNLNETYKNWETEQVRELPEVRVGWRLTTSPQW
jgi:hypothetical protein